ncbi:MAG: 30S ribosomal protein S16 [Candidatus Marinimicrobia bacterium]|nr:30S ribosomal protein S16 [Candidatus Neomarinimicrobiota bacterium]
MAVKIRLKRMGKKKQPFYRIVVADSRAPRDGRSIEKIGHYNPIPDPADLVIDEERLFHWMDQGAKPSDTVFSLLRGRGLTLKYELVSRNADEATISKEMHKWELARDDRGKKAAAVESAKLAAAEAAKQAEEDAAQKAEEAEEAAKKAAEAEAAAEKVEETEEVAEVVEEVAEVVEETEKAAEVVEEVAEVVEEVAAEEEPVEAPAEGTEKQDS